MNSSDQLFALFWKLAALVVCVIIVSTSSCTIYRNKAIKDIVMQGYDPTEASCAYNIEGSLVQCAIRSSQK